MEISKFKSSNGINEVAYYVYEIENPIAIMHITHGMCEYIKRYEHFIKYLNEQKIMVVGHDHLGHGLTGDLNGTYGFFSEKNGDKHLSEDLHLLICLIKEKYNNVPYFVFGHSMGSFVSRCYLSKYSKEIDGIIICGTGGKNSLASSGIMLSSVISKVKGKKYVSKFLYKLIMGNFSKKTKDNTGVEWLTRDTEIYNGYINDKYCRIKFSAKAYNDLLKLSKNSNSKKWYKNFELPIYLISGDEDVVGGNGKEIKYIYKHLEQKANNVEMKLYPGARHELVNEFNKEEVFNDVNQFIRKNIGLI
ncbi:MAG: alpha/beta fold hydrolase [bacterium]